MSTNWRTGRWNGAVVLGFCTSAVGVSFDRPELVLAAIVGIGFATYPHMTKNPPTEFNIEHKLDTTSPEHESPVTVTVEVTNESGRYAPNVQIVDGVPDLLTVTSGSARHATALANGESAEFSYEVVAKHGEYQFQPVTIFTGDTSGGTEVELRGSSNAEIVCQPDLDEVPIPDRLIGSGRKTAETAGDGVEFHRTRAYRHGDPPNRIDWRRFARTGDLSTVEYRDDSVASIVLCLDVRRIAYCRSNDGDPHAVAYGVAAAKSIATALQQRHHRVGLAVIGPTFRWIAPNTRGETRSALDKRLDWSPLLSPQPPDEDTENIDTQVTNLAAKLTRRDQLVVITPLVDSKMADGIKRLRRRCKASHVVSPNVTNDITTGGAVGQLQRNNRIAALERSNVPVTDWNPERSLDEAFRQTKQDYRR